MGNKNTHDSSINFFVTVFCQIETLIQVVLIQYCISTVEICCDRPKHVFGRTVEELCNVRLRGAF